MPCSEISQDVIGFPSMSRVVLQKPEHDCLLEILIQYRISFEIINNKIK
jgi:hypothetical protein